MKRKYENAIEVLNRRRRIARPSSTSYLPLDRGPSLSGKPDLRGTPSITGMKQWLQQIGHSTTDVDKLNIIHVAGTKGKGSTCAFIDSFLQCHSKRTGFPYKTGLYSSPHLIVPEERIRINTKPLGRSAFTKYFFEVLDTLPGLDSDTSEIRPRYLQLCLLVALHSFIREGVDAAIIETHHGGEFDSTNVVKHPVVTAITSLGMDHVNQLGPLLENIAWHKAGIFKLGAAAFSVVEDAPIEKVLQDRATAKGVDLEFVSPDPCLPRDEVNLTPDVQRLNCSLALAAVRAFISRRSPVELDSRLHMDDILEGIRRFSWPGRFQIIVRQNRQWFLDGAHNEMSAAVVARWFIEASAAKGSRPLPRILVFGQITKQRDSTAVIKELAASFQPGDIQVAIFTMYEPHANFEATFGKLDGSGSQSDSSNDILLLQSFAEVWTARHPESQIVCTSNLPQALAKVNELEEGSDGVQTLVTGSQHLVGAALFYLGDLIL